MDLTYEQRARLSGLIDDYKNIGAYRRKSKLMNYVQFDYDIVHEAALFMIEPELSFDALEESTDVILKALPSVKRIFAQPFIHLKERDVILPVESVRIVNNNTLNHIASHSELWEDVKRGEIKPKKLLSRTYEDDYGIYENKVFCNVVDEILCFTRANIRFLKELIYANQTIEINLLERVNHLNYFLALGKLHIGYSKSFGSYYAVAGRCLNKLQFIENAIVPRLKRPVYKNNKLRSANLRLRKTNILSMHKEYHRVYKLAKYFACRNALKPVKEFTEKDAADLEKNYFFFCQTLLIFAIGHFNFNCDSKKLFSLSRVNVEFEFKGWKLKLGALTPAGRQVICFEMIKDKPYKVILAPCADGDGAAVLSAVKQAEQADEYLLCTPVPGQGRDAVLVDISNIESFRRLQQIVLRAMVYSDTEREVCPFCGEKLAENNLKAASGGRVYECSSCRTEIHEDICRETGKPFLFTTISDLKPGVFDDGELWLKERRAESAMYFRNITAIDENNSPVCPHCGKVH